MLLNFFAVSIILVYIYHKRLHLIELYWWSLFLQDAYSCIFYVAPWLKCNYKSQSIYYSSLRTYCIIHLPIHLDATNVLYNLRQCRSWHKPVSHMKSIIMPDKNQSGIDNLYHSHLAINHNKFPCVFIPTWNSMLPNTEQEPREMKVSTAENVQYSDSNKVILHDGHS